MSADNIFPKHWGLENLNELAITGTDFPKTPSFHNAIEESAAGVNYLSPFVRDFEFTIMNSNEIADNYFYNLPQKNIGKNILLVKEPECETDITPYIVWLYKDLNNDDKYQKDVDELAYTIKIYISTQNSKLEKLYNCMQDYVGDNEILFFMEDNTDDFSDQSLYACYGKNVTKEGLLKLSDKNMDFIAEKIPDFDRDKLRELITTGQVKAKSSLLTAILKGNLWVGMVANAIPKAVGWLSNQIGDIIADNLKIPEKIWDSHSEEYFLNKDNLINDLQIDTSFLNTLDSVFIKDNPFSLITYIPVGQKIIASHVELAKHFVNQYNKFIDYAINYIYEEAEQVALGLNTAFNLTESIAFFCGIWNGLVDFIADIFKFIGLLEIPFDMANNYQEFLEATDDFRENLKNFSFIDFFITALLLKLEIDKQIYEFFTSENPKEEYNFDKIAYFSGYGIAFIASLFVPLADLSRIASVTKVKKFVPNDFIEAINLAGNKTIKSSKAFITFIREMGELLGKKGKALYDELKKIIDNIIAWFKKNAKIFESTFSKIKDTFLKEAKTEEYFRKIQKKFNLAGEEILSIYDLKKLRRLLKETFDVPLVLVEQIPKLKGKLKNWKIRRVAGAFNMVEGVMYLRKNVTAYTVQHEMFHMKLWYKMTKEFPELQPLLQKTLGRENRLFHEEYVLSEFMKDSSKWLEADLLNDLNFINKELRKAKGLPEVDLEYYKKWNLEEELLKFE